MPWHEKPHTSRFDHEPIPGLNYLIGDLYARQYRQRHLEGRKYATVTFPSGLTRAVDQAEQQLTVHILGGLNLPLLGDRDVLYNHVEKYAPQQGLRIEKAGQDQLTIWRPDAGEAFVIRVENGHILDILRQEVQHKGLMSRSVELLDAESRALLPPLYANEHLGLEAFAPVKFFTPTSAWTWYPTEYDGDDLFFGLVAGFEVELGYFSLSELEQVRGPLGLLIERDLYFEPQSLRDLKRLHEDWR